MGGEVEAVEVVVGEAIGPLVVEAATLCQVWWFVGLEK
jgi:hypothetical protein